MTQLNDIPPFVATRQYKRGVVMAIKKARKLWDKGHSIPYISRATNLKQDFLEFNFPKQDDIQTV